MKEIQRVFVLLISVLFVSTSFTASGPLFMVTSTGTEADISITLCLNGQGPLSCQNFTVTALNLSILTSAPNHTYPAAGIKINTPGYTIQNAGIDCTLANNGYCLFSMSDALPKQLNLQNGSISSSEIALVGGQYGDATPLFYPVLAQSTDEGDTWTYRVEKGMNLPAGFNTSGIFFSTNCSGTTCLAAGRYRDNATIQYPLLAQSTNGGVTWFYKIEKGLNLPTGFNDVGLFNSTNCSGTTCLAVGAYRDNPGFLYPLLAQSTDGGTNWAYRIEKGLNLPTGFNDVGLFNSTNCSGTTCLAVGEYRDNTNISYPVLAQSTDGGSAWTYRIEKGLNLPTDFNNNGFLFSTDCNGTTCLAAGRYRDNLGIQYPLLAQSSDGGSTWTYRIEKGLNLPADFNNFGFLFSTDCNGTTCLAVGEYRDNINITYPLLAQSNDGGATWTYKIEKGLNLPTDFNNNGFLFSTDCNGTTCLAVGAYRDNTNIQYPLLAQSNNGGATWTYKIEKGLNLPTDFNDFGNLRNTSTTSLSAYLPDSLKYLTASQQDTMLRDTPSILPDDELK